ncbi:MAG TPA: hypothetical protein PLZ36_03065 [Armatimonadota bacterium]|nr:hypothetical protein [Armatimonadota bacterium]
MVSGTTPGVDWQAKARALLNGRALAVGGFAQAHTTHFDAETFEQYVAQAAEFGATHVHVGWVPFHYGSWYLPDNVDPYASWSIGSLGILRFFPPKALQRWISAESAQPLQAWVEAQVAILRKYGLKGQASGCEPQWLPEDVYQAHPHWRGAQCELGRIARRPYFAPSIDEPEVLELYREAMAEIARRFPEIESFSFLGNDSGAGIAWSPCLYPGMNGPTQWRMRDPGERICNWLTAMQEGAASEGVEITVNTVSSGLPAGTVAAARARCATGQYVNGGNNLDENRGGPGAHLGGGLWTQHYPVVGLGQPVEFVAGLQQVFHNPDGDHKVCSLGYDEYHLPLARVLLESFLENPGTGLLNRGAVLLAAAEKLTGSADAAEELVGVWADLSQAHLSMSKIPQKGAGSLLMPWLTVSARWLVRPLVPKPEELTEDETAHYRPFLFSVDTDEKNAHYCLILGKPLFSGSCAVWMTRWNLVDAINRVTSCRQRVKKLARDCADAELAGGLALFAARLGAYACLAETIRNTVMFQYALDTAGEPQFGPNMMDYDDNIIYDMRALSFRKIAREEVDNVADLLRILDEHAGPIFHLGATPAEETVFTYGPALRDYLQRKLDIMLAHWQDYEELYPSTKVWDFEPAPRGSIAAE